MIVYPEKTDDSTGEAVDSSEGQSSSANVETLFECSQLCAQCAREVGAKATQHATSTATEMTEEEARKRYKELQDYERLQSNKEFIAKHEARIEARGIMSKSEVDSIKKRYNKLIDYEILLFKKDFIAKHEAAFNAMETTSKSEVDLIDKRYRELQNYETYQYRINYIAKYDPQQGQNEAKHMMSEEKTDQMDNHRKVDAVVEGLDVPKIPNDGSEAELRHDIPRSPADDGLFAEVSIRDRIATQANATPAETAIVELEEQMAKDADEEISEEVNICKATDNIQGGMHGYRDQQPSRSSETNVRPDAYNVEDGLAREELMTTIKNLEDTASVLRFSTAISDLVALVSTLSVWSILWTAYVHGKVPRGAFDHWQKPSALQVVLLYGVLWGSHLLDPMLLRCWGLCVWRRENPDKGAVVILMMEDLRALLLLSIEVIAAWILKCIQMGTS
ncbi:hypothetical protein MMC25_001561 [Agyrium rufum]|nr:hypothetical protein [Agyrium rufum]